jgi:hypothetical protein
MQEQNTNGARAGGRGVGGRAAPEGVPDPDGTLASWTAERYDNFVSQNRHPRDSACLSR